MPVAYSDIAEHVAAGKTAAEIAAILAADTRHVRDVMATSSDPHDTDLLDVLGEFGLIGIGDSGGWEGPLVTAILAAGSPVLNEGWRRLKMNLQVTNRPVRCGSSAEIGSLVTAITGLAMQAMPSRAAEIKSLMDSLTGGLRFAGVTELAVQKVVDDNRDSEVVRIKIGWLSEANAAADQYVAANPDATAAEIKAVWMARFDEVTA